MIGICRVFSQFHNFTFEWLDFVNTGYIYNCMNKPPPILFQNRDEITSRPRFVAALTCSENDLDYIVGKYPFSTENRVQCGVNSCNQWHQNGFLIALKSGDETLCGHVCGVKEFGIVWNDLEAAIDRRLEENKRAENLKKLQDESTATLERCANLIETCSQLAVKISSIVSEVSKDVPFKTLFESALKNDGKITHQVKTSTGRFTTVIKATFSGTYSIEARKAVLRELKNNVAIPTAELQKLQLSLLSPQETQSWSTRLLEVTRTFVLADKFQNEAKIFLSHANLNNFVALHDTLTKAQRVTRTKKILETIRSSQI